jgi:HAD superfamily hydrolase (TIGR01509 family)
MQRRIEALLFDLGRVVIDLDQARAHARWAELASVPISDIAALVRERILAKEAYCRHERGEISDAQFFAHLRQQLKLALSDAQFVDGWNSIFIGEIPGIRRVLANLQGLLPLYAFSNTNVAHHAYWSRHFRDLLVPFRKIYLSHEIGARKPEPAAFRTVVADMGLAPDRVLFFDDSAENVAGARACGLMAVEVTTAAPGVPGQAFNPVMR